MRDATRVLVPAALLLALGLAACGSSGGAPAPSTVPDGAVVADFALLDQNPVTPTSGAAVSPRDHLGQVSAWYFGLST